MGSPEEDKTREVQAHAGTVRPQPELKLVGGVQFLAMGNGPSFRAFAYDAYEEKWVRLTITEDNWNEIGPTKRGPLSDFIEGSDNAR